MQKNIYKFFSNINAAIKRNQVEVRTTACFKAKLISVFLRDNGYINGFYQEEKTLVILLKYLQKRPVLKQIIAVSKPGRKVFISLEAYNKLVLKLAPNQFISTFSLTVPLIFRDGFLYQPNNVTKFSKGGELICCIVI